LKSDHERLLNATGIQPMQREKGKASIGRNGLYIAIGALKRRREAGIHVDILPNT